MLTIDSFETFILRFRIFQQERNELANCCKFQFSRENLLFTLLCFKDEKKNNPEKPADSSLTDLRNLIDQPVEEKALNKGSTPMQQIKPQVVHTEPQWSP